MPFLDRIRACNNVQDLSPYRPFVVDGHRVGWIGDGFAREIARFDDVFRVENGALGLAPDLASYDTRTSAVDAVLRALQAEGLFPAWRGEPYPVGTGWQNSISGAKVTSMYSGLAAISVTDPWVRSYSPANRRTLIPLT